jgi:hypothetical protein
MATKELIGSFEKLWSDLCSQSLNIRIPEVMGVDVTVLTELEQRLCPKSREYRNCVNFFKNQLQNRSSLDIFLGSLTAISLIPQSPQIKPCLNYLLLAVKELNLPSPIVDEASMVNHTPPHLTPP